MNFPVTILIVAVVTIGITMLQNKQAEEALIYCEAEKECKTQNRENCKSEDEPFLVQIRDCESLNKRGTK